MAYDIWAESGIGRPDYCCGREKTCERHCKWAEDEQGTCRHQALADAWDEGYEMGDPYQRRGNPNEGKHRNPYRVPDFLPRASLAQVETGLAEKVKTIADQLRAGRANGYPPPNVLYIINALDALLAPGTPAEESR